MKTKYQLGQAIEVEFAGVNNTTHWVEGTFIAYATALDRVDKRIDCMVNGKIIHGAAPECVRPKKLEFNEWFKTWPKAEAYNRAEGSQGTGLRRAHSLMTQASRDYKKYTESKQFKTSQK